MSQDFTIVNLLNTTSLYKKRYCNFDGDNLEEMVVESLVPEEKDNQILQVSFETTTIINRLSFISNGLANDVLMFQFDEKDKKLTILQRVDHVPHASMKFAKAFWTNATENLKMVNTYTEMPLIFSVWPAGQEVNSNNQVIFSIDGSSGKYEYYNPEKKKWVQPTTTFPLTDFGGKRPHAIMYKKDLASNIENRDVGDYCVLALLSAVKDEPTKNKLKLFTITFGKDYVPNIVELTDDVPTDSIKATKTSSLVFFDVSDSSSPEKYNLYCVGGKFWATYTEENEETIDLSQEIFSQENVYEKKNDLFLNEKKEVFESDDFDWDKKTLKTFNGGPLKYYQSDIYYRGKDGDKNNFINLLCNVKFEDNENVSVSFDDNTNSFLLWEKYISTNAALKQGKSLQNTIVLPIYDAGANSSHLPIKNTFICFNLHYMKDGKINFGDASIVYEKTDDTKQSESSTERVDLGMFLYSDFYPSAFLTYENPSNTTITMSTNTLTLPFNNLSPSATSFRQKKILVVDKKDSNFYMSLYSLKEQDESTTNPWPLERRHKPIPMPNDSFSPAASQSHCVYVHDTKYGSLFVFFFVSGENDKYKLHMITYNPINKIFTDKLVTLPQEFVPSKEDARLNDAFFGYNNAQNETLQTATYITTDDKPSIFISYMTKNNKEYILQVELFGGKEEDKNVAATLVKTFDNSLGSIFSFVENGKEDGTIKPVILNLTDKTINLYDLASKGDPDVLENKNPIISGKLCTLFSPVKNAYSVYAVVRRSSSSETGYDLCNFENDTLTNIQENILGSDTKVLYAIPVHTKNHQGILILYEDSNKQKQCKFYSTNSLKIYNVTSLLGETIIFMGNAP